jgi:hypothetical protein
MSSQRDASDENMSIFYLKKFNSFIKCIGGSDDILLIINFSSLYLRSTIGYCGY